ALRSNNKKGFQPRVEKKDLHRINEFVKAPEVRLVGDNVEMGVYKTSVALKMAEEMELDLVEISPNAEPPVCNIMDYKKLLYEQKKREKELKAKSAQITVKEISFPPQKDKHDYELKTKDAEKYWNEAEK